ncbi:DEAD/DEAH box helicase [Clostridium vincentii]|uniref:ATP-dependent helicase HepA n=1 Tax=Clostridium vincentii TaxID=52704 RepID=A0A2T0BC00_9CLOT|nr:DEAD/DEAH box helicase [Clostridium vincentii]PRR81337.1 ATP-dependent helicase HepA [Clostridium vincentii]
MIKQALIEGFKKSTYGKKDHAAHRILKNDLISNIKYDSNEDCIYVLSSVISEELYSQYSCKLDIDRFSKEVLFTSCSCVDFEKSSSKQRGYCCKHLTATFYKFILDLDEELDLKDRLNMQEPKERLIAATESSILDFLLGNDKKIHEVKLEVVINRISWSGKIAAEFKIGLKGMKSNKLYSLKDIDGFLVAINNNIPITYGKDFVFNIKEQGLNIKDKKIIEFIELLKEIDFSSSSYKKVNEKLVLGKQITIPKALLRQFMNIICHHRVYLGSGFYSRQLETEIINGPIPFPMKLKEVGNMLKLEAVRGVPEALSDIGDIYLYDTIIYLPPDNQMEGLTPYIEAFNHGNTIFFTKAEEDRVLRELIPSIQKVTGEIELSTRLSNKVVIAPAKFKFYFDKDEEIHLTLKVLYDKYEFNYFDTYEEKVIYRDKNAEDKVLMKLRELGFESVNDKFIFFKDEEHIFSFFKDQVKDIQELGEVYYSDRFTGIKTFHDGAFKGDVKKGKYDYFEFKFKLGDIPKEENAYILNAFRDSKKYYRLKSGEFLDLEEIEMKKFLKLLDSLEKDNNLEENVLNFHKSKGIYLEDYLEDEEIKYVKGRRGLKALKNSLNDLKNTNFILPDDINANLRNYQKDGYYWLKTLDFLGFGGILGDEMGLGKTLQTITFLASNKGKSTLIVAPTSLVYNWNNEFKKFAPTMKIAILNGSKNDREDLLRSTQKYDAYITTYNLLKRDADIYETIEFDYCILDEAQNIKNPSSQNAKTAKGIKATRKFALTGTPIENSLMELWSIFDFIMPGYLYNEKRFAARYHRRLEEEDVIIEELTRLIKPFILRRYKKDVIKELPDKIEKNLIVPMDEKQLVVYTTYAKYAQELIENKVKDDEFKKSKIEILSYITKLRQICLDPSVVMDNYDGGSGKIDALLETVIQGIDEGHKILVFSQFTSVLKNIAKRFKENDVTFTYLDGSTPSKLRGKLVEDFNEDNTSVFLISLKAGGTGLNLTSADIVIHFDPWWNPAVEEQATDRAHRIGQRKVVQVIKMIAEGSIEEKIVDLQEQKKLLIDKVVGGKVDLGGSLSSLQENDILSLFSKNI